jgi:hypothetical protein
MSTTETRKPSWWSLIVGKRGMRKPNKQIRLPGPNCSETITEFKADFQPSQAHQWDCDCVDLNSSSCAKAPEAEAIRLTLDLEQAISPPCQNPYVCLCNSPGGRNACLHAWAHYLVLNSTIGASFNLDHFNGSPQQHALLNRHLVDYYRDRTRSQETTPYNIPNSQRHLLQPLGMELPQPDAPETPHALHKCIEEFQLRRTARLLLQPNNFGVISVKNSKLTLLPTPGSVQNPVFEAKDVTRYPGSAIKHAHFKDFPVHLLHDVTSEVSPHELVEKLVAENPEGHLIATGMNPIEVLDRAASFEPASHTIEYDLDSFNFVFTGSEAESYFTPAWVTNTWLRTSSVCASNGRVYHVTLLDYKLGHCVWHIYCGNAADQHTRTFSTGSYVRIPAVVSGTLTDEYLPVNLLSGILDFVGRTPDLSTRNLSAKVSQLATGINPRATARDRWVATYVAGLLAPNKDFWWYFRKTFWNFMYAVTFQWHMLRPLPDIYSYVDERKRTRVIHPTPGGGWSPRTSFKVRKASIPNMPSTLQRLSAFTASVFVFMIPKILIGEVITNVILKLDYFGFFKTLWRLAEIDIGRFLLTLAVIVVTAIIPGSVVKVFSRLAGHFWRQLWMPGWIKCGFELLVHEVVGAPGYKFLFTLPGRGWFYQAYLWIVASYSVLPGLPFMWAFPWYCLTVPHGWLFFAIWAAIILENLIACAPKCPVPSSFPKYHYNLLNTVKHVWNKPRESYVWSFFLTATACWTAWTFVILMCRTYNVIRSIYIHPSMRGNCDRAGCLPAVNVAQPQTVRKRYVDLPLPSVTVIPDRIPVQHAVGGLAVDPIGLNLPDWRDQVEAAYRNQPNAYPQLTPGQSCFWDCLAKFGGTPHMWYSWFMAFTRRTPNPNDPVVGNVTLPEIQEFAVVSRFGVAISGLVSEVIQPQGADRPTLNLHLRRSAIRGQLHIEWVDPTTSTQPVANLARILSTILRVHPNWDIAIQNAFNQAPVDQIPRPTPILCGFAGEHELPKTREDIADAIVASRTALPIQAAPNNEGFGFDRAVIYNAPYPPLFTFDPPIVNLPIARTEPSVMWRRFTSLARTAAGRLRLKVTEPHPLTDKSMKIGASREQHRSNAMQGNIRPEPPMWTVLRNELEQELKDFKQLRLPPVKLQQETIQYTADLQRAMRLVADLKAHPSVLESRASPVVLQSLDSILDAIKVTHTTVTKPVHAYLGVWGSGKTTATVAFLHTLTPEQRRNVRIVSHTESLRAQAKSKIDFPELRGYNFPTIASIIAEPSTGGVIFDDAGKYWGGVLDLVMLTNPLAEFFVVNGDPCQTTSRFPVPGSQSEFDPSPITCIANLATRYATVSHRSFGLLANTLGVHTTNPNNGHITHTVTGKTGIPVCTASPRYVQVLGSYGRQAYTYSSIQGEDFDQDVEIDMTGLEGAVLDSAAYVALTRSKTGVYVHMEAMDPRSTIRKPPTGSEIINALVYCVRAGNSNQLLQPDWLIKAAFYRHIKRCIPCLPWFADIGASVGVEHFQQVLPVSNYHVIDEGSTSEMLANEAVQPSDGPIENLVPETHFIAKEHREERVRGGGTDQFKETAFVNPHVHKRNDTATYFLSVEQRLKPSSYEANLARMASVQRRDMCEAYDKLVPHPPKWSAEKHQHYVDQCISEYCSKRTESAVLSKLKAHDPTRTGSDIVISLKNQVIKKDEKRHKIKAIPGQLIHEYDISITLGDAPYALFLENEITPAFPDNYLFYRRMSPPEFIKAYKSKWRVNNGAYSSDVTRWDVGCDAGMLNFDVHVMQRSGFPADYIEAYIMRRLSSKSQHGVMATMQNSGDRYTWPLNTVRRAVVTSIVCDVKPEDTVAVNGDDAAIDRNCSATQFPDSPWVFKDCNGYRVEFSGFELGGPEPTYSASGIWYRTAILMSRDPSAQDKWVNYLDLLQYTDLNDPHAIDVARAAHQHMKPVSRFAECLPEPLRPHFPTVVF